MSRAKWITVYEKRAILALLELGLSDAQVAEKVGRSRIGIRLLRTRCGVPRKEVRMAPPRAEQVAS